jgi:predicted lipase
LTAWNSVADHVISTVRTQLVAHPGYTIVTTGHSLGGSLSSLAGLSMKSNFPSNPVQLYTFGQLRTGDAAYATLVESTLGTGNVFRGTHTTDFAPALISQSIGYKHHGIEFWNFKDPGKFDVIST